MTDEQITTFVRIKALCGIASIGEVDNWCESQFGSKKNGWKTLGPDSWVIRNPDFVSMFILKWNDQIEIVFDVDKYGMEIIKNG